MVPYGKINGGLMPISYSSYLGKICWKLKSFSWFINYIPMLWGSYLGEWLLLLAICECSK